MDNTAQAVQGNPDSLLPRQLKRKKSSIASTTLEEPPKKRAAGPISSIKPKRHVRFLIFSDTHDADESEDDESTFQTPIKAPIVDIVLHCGDLTSNGTPTSLVKAIKKLAAIPAQHRLIIAGNHDITLDKDYYLSQGGGTTDHAAAIKIVKEDAAVQGVTYLDEGTHTFTLTDNITISIYASPYTPRYGESAFQYSSGTDRFNPAATTPAWATNTATAASIVPEGVDVVMTHGPPKYVLDDTGHGSSGGCEHLRRAICRAKPRLHCFGHVHRGYGAQRVLSFDDNDMQCETKEWVGKNQARRKGYAQLSPGSTEKSRDSEQTLMVNAAIMDDEGRATNMPWLVELEL